MPRNRVLAPALVVFLACASPASAQEVWSWSPKTEAYDFNFGGYATDGSYLYLFGGNQQGVVDTYPEYHQQLRRYDPAANAWTTLAALPAMAHYTAGAYCNGRLFSFGGYNGTGISNAIHAYTIASDTWATLNTTLNVPRYHLSAATVGTRIYIMGGYYMGSTNANEEFNTANDSILMRASVPAGRWSQAAAVLDGRVYLIGGYANGYSTGNYEYTPSDLGYPWGSWATLSPLPQARMGAAAFTLNGLVHVAGGTTATTSSDTWIYSRVTNAWIQGPDMNEARSYHAAAAIGGLGYVYGGPAAPSIATGEEYASNEPPTADAGIDQTVEWSGSDLTSVTLDGSGSADPDDDPMTYDWTGDFGSASGVNPTIDLPLGTSTITLTVTDPSDASSMDTVVITVVDSSPPPAVNYGGASGGGGGGSGGCGSVGFDLMLPLLAVMLWKRRKGRRQ